MTKKLRPLSNSFFILVICLFAVGCNNSEIFISPKKNKSSGLQEININDDSTLSSLIKNLETSYSTNGRMSKSMTTSFGNLSTDKALKVQNDSSDITRYTLKLSASNNTKIYYENLIIRNAPNNVTYYILQYEPDLLWYLKDSKRPDFKDFTGYIRQLDLKRTVLMEVYLVNGKSSKKNGVGGRTQDCCTLTVMVSQVSDYPYLYMDCGSYGYLIPLRMKDCGGSGGDVGSGGFGDSGGDSGGGNSGGGGDQSGGGGSSGGSGDGGIGIYIPDVDWENNWVGKDDGLPNNWWQDENWLNTNFSLNLDEGGTYDRLTAAEKALIKQYPGPALFINKNREKAELETSARFGGNGLNDKSDAFRHAFFNSMNERDCGKDPFTLASIARKFSDAHESEVPAQLSKEKEMDLWNNNIGHLVGNVTFPIFSLDSSLADEVMLRLLNGDLRYLSPIYFGDPNFTGAGGTVDAQTATHGIYMSTQLIPTNQ